MQLYHFDFNLPKNLIAQYPIKNRDESKLLVAKDINNLKDYYFYQIESMLNPNDVLIINNTKVIKARVFGKKDTGGKIEGLIERILSENLALMHIKSSKALKINTKLIFIPNIEAKIIGRQDDLYYVQFFIKKSLEEVLDDTGIIPLPPYIEHQANENDEIKYQTIYAKHKGAIAAPTAGLHFSEKLLLKLKSKGVIIAPITLHVGSGTFKPIRTANINEHKMHKEWINITQDTADIINRAKDKQQNICAVGTTSIRAIESASKNGKLNSYQGFTDIFIKPGYQFQIANMLITNFHLPKSTLLMLVSAFAGYDETKKIYQYAIEKNYRFFSYGDACLLHRK